MYLLINVLRNKLGFEGVILTDWEDIRKLHDRDKVAETQKEAVKMAINAGIDMSRVPYEYEQFFNDLIQLVKNHTSGLGDIGNFNDKDVKSHCRKDIFVLSAKKSAVVLIRNYLNSKLRNFF